MSAQTQSSEVCKHQDIPNIPQVKKILRSRSISNRNDSAFDKHSLLMGRGNIISLS